MPTDSYGFNVSTAATEPLCSLADLREHLGFAVDNYDQDTILYRVAAAAEDYCQRATGRQFVTATLEHLIDRWPLSNRPLYLPRSPLSSVSSISYLDTDGASQTWASSNYNVITKDEPGYVELGYEKNYPANRIQAHSITITYVAGYGEPPEVPEMLKSAVLLLAAHWFEQRTPVITGTIVAQIPMTVTDILNHYAVPELWAAYARAI